MEDSLFWAGAVLKGTITSAILLVLTPFWIYLYVLEQIEYVQRENKRHELFLRCPDQPRPYDEECARWHQTHRMIDEQSGLLRIR